MRFQQLTGPVMAKGVEDTAFYNYNRLVSLNEVGGDPGGSASRVEEFHAACAEAQRRWPRTHARHLDPRHQAQRGRAGPASACSRRSPSAGREAVRRWSSATRRHRTGGDCPDRNAEYLLYQTLVGAWPIDGRARWRPTWRRRPARPRPTPPGPTRRRPTRRRCARFVEARAGRPGVRRRPRGLRGARWSSRGGSTRWPRRCSSSPSPGVPDIYQGTRALGPLAWSIPTTAARSTTSLRRAAARRAEERHDAGGDPRPHGRGPAQALADPPGAPAAPPESRGLRTEGSYEPLRVSGPRADHAVAFARGGEVAVVVPRLPLRLGGDWRGHHHGAAAGRLAQRADRGRGRGRASGRSRSCWRDFRWRCWPALKM